MNGYYFLDTLLAIADLERNDETIGLIYIIVGAS